MQPFNLAAQADFEKWAEYKLSLYSQSHLEQIAEPVIIRSDGRPSEVQLNALRERLQHYNFALYRVENDEIDKGRFIHLLGQSLGLQQLDANICAEEDLLSVITDSPDDDSRKARYIPYSNKALGWHTDGYYNPLQQRVRAFILHCRQQADRGGENLLIDPEIIYLLLRRQNAGHIRALCRPDVMTIPANTQNGVCLREATSSAVFQVSDNFRQLAMRYSRRKRHIHWRADDLTQNALNDLNHLLDTESRWRIKIRLGAGEGIVSNNVLHCRESYRDSAANKRIYLRARYYNAINFG